MLKADAIPTLFPHNLAKQPQKRRASLRREETASKRQFCEDALHHNKLVESLEFDVNTKEVQTELEYNSVSCMTSPEVKSVSTQVESIMNDFGVQCNIELLEYAGKDEESQSDYESSDESEYQQSEGEYDDESFSDAPTNCPTVMPSKTAFIVYWSSLVVLFKMCLTCSLPATIKNITVKGSQLIVKLICPNKHENTWKSQPSVNRYSKGNLTLSAAVLFSTNTFEKIAKYFDIADIQWITKTSYYAIQKKFLAGVVHLNYCRMNASLVSRLKVEGECKLSGDGRHDSPGHNAKYVTYSLMNQQTNEIIAFAVSQVTEAGNSNRMEKHSFIKVLKEVKQKGIPIKQLTTDRHSGIRKYMREEEAEITHQFDVWHFAKNIKKKIDAVSKKKSCTILQKWRKSISNHFWWACATSEGDEELLREKWLSVLFHIQNKHKWRTGKRFKKCNHRRLTKKEVKAKEWLSADSEAFKALQNIVTDENTLKDLKYLTKFSHTGILEIYHALYNKWVPKSQHFCYLGMVTRSQLAIMDFNKGSELKQATTKKGEKRYNVCFSKVTKSWSSKPIKGKKEKSYLKNMVKETIEYASSKKSLEIPKIPNLPKNIASVPKPDKQEIINNQTSRFK